MDSTSYDAIGWSCLRIWEESGGVERFHKVALRPLATPIEGEATQATAELELQGYPTVGDYVELAWLDQHANWQVSTGDTLEGIVAGLATFINAKPYVTAAAEGTRLRLTYSGAPGANGNRVGVYASIQGAQTESWMPSWSMFGGGKSPTRWRVDLDFSSLRDTDGQQVATTNVRRMRWTWAADLQLADFTRSEFDIAISNWRVEGTNIGQRVAGPGSRRIEDDAPEVGYTGVWAEERGNYSGGSIRHSQEKGAEARCVYAASSDHLLYLGTRYSHHGADVTVRVDDRPPVTLISRRALEDELIRAPIGSFAEGPHTVTVTHAGLNGEDIFFDFLEVALPASTMRVFGPTTDTTLATDWDTDHSLAIAPERTAWLMDTLGFRGRANHYAGAMWFYEIANPGNRYASASIEFAGTPELFATTSVTIAGSTIEHVNLITDTAEGIAKCFELLLAAGSSAVWASAEGSTLRITSRTPGEAGNAIGISTSTGSETFTATRNSPTLSGGANGEWFTDLGASPRLNRAARDWTRSYIAALNGYGIDATVAFSMELRNGDDSLEAGIAQRYPDRACELSTPALQTNFGPASTAFWKQAYRDMADVMTEAGADPYLQFGEVQWWYFADTVGMPFYDTYTRTLFGATYGTEMRTIASEQEDPERYPEEVALLPRIIGEYTEAVMAYVRQAHPDCRFEVLYPPDTNDTPIGRAVNYPLTHWTPAALSCLKTENFTFTGDRNLDNARISIQLPGARGFPPAQRSHLIGIGDYTSPWRRERQLAIAEGVESVVLFALDQFCLIGYSLPLDGDKARSGFMGTA